MILTLLLVLYVSIVASIIESDKNVLVLTDDNFDEALSTYNHLLVEFYAPWCKHCKSYEPIWNEAASYLNGLDMKLGKLNTDTNNKTDEKYQITKLPTTKYFKDGVFKEDFVGMTSSDIITWATKQVGLYVKSLVTLDDLDKFRTPLKVFVLGLFTSLESKNVKLFNDIAEHSSNYAFAMSTSADILAHYLVDKDTIVIIKDFEDKRSDLVLSSSTEAEEMLTFVNGFTTPLVQEFTMLTAASILSNPIQMQMIYFTDPETSSHHKLLKSMHPLAEAHRGRMIFFYVPVEEEPVLRLFDLIAEDLPAIVLANSTTGKIKRYPYPGDLYDAQEITDFIEMFHQGKLRSAMKSEEVLAEDTAEALKYVKGHSFDDIVIKNDANVFVAMSAPGCKACREMMSVWSTLATAYEYDDAVTLAVYDARNNEIEVENMDVRLVPSAYFFKANDKTHPIMYQGAMTKEKVREFIEANAYRKYDDRDEL